MTRAWNENGKGALRLARPAALVAVSGMALAVALTACSSAATDAKPVNEGVAAAVSTPSSSVAATSPFPSVSATMAAPTPAPSTTTAATATTAPPTKPSTTLPKTTTTTPMAPSKKGAACVIGTWAVTSMKQSFNYSNTMPAVPSSYESGTLRVTYGKDGTFSVQENNLRVGGKAWNGTTYENVANASGSTTYVIHGDGTITYGAIDFAVGTNTIYIDHVAQPLIHQSEYIGTLDNYTCEGNSFHISGRDIIYTGLIYSYNFYRVS